jgi:hypothetical protein
MQWPGSQRMEPLRQVAALCRVEVDRQQDASEHQVEDQDFHGRTCPNYGHNADHAGRL